MAGGVACTEINLMTQSEFAHVYIYVSYYSKNDICESTLTLTLVVAALYII